VRRYNKTILKQLRKAHRHITYAEWTLNFGILECDFRKEIRILASVAHQIYGVILKEEEVREGESDRGGIMTE